MKLWILTIDSDEQYTATLHNSKADAEAEVIAIFGENAETDDPEVVIEYAQDTGREVNITEAEVPDDGSPRLGVDNMDPDGLITIPAEYADIPGAQSDDNVTAIALIDLARWVIAEVKLPADFTKCETDGIHYRSSRHSAAECPATRPDWH